MLYDPKWDHAEIWSLPRFIAWLEQQPTNGTWNFCSNKDCLICQYLQACGVANPFVTPMEYWDSVDLRCWEKSPGKPYPDIFNRIAHERNFGGALAYARGAHAKALTLLAA